MKEVPQYNLREKARDFKHVGIILIITGLLCGLYGISVYRNGKQAYVAQTKMGAKYRMPVQSGNKYFLGVASFGFLLAGAGIFPLLKSHKLQKKL